MRRMLAPYLLAALLAAACGAQPAANERPSSTRSATAPAPDERTSAPEPPVSSPRPAATSTPTPRARLARGVDASHHQGAIDWERVRRDGISFAYVKATEGSSFTDPRFVEHARSARRAGLRVGGYHYFTLCSAGAPQAEHFAEVLEVADAGSLPPAIDLELLGNCSDPPPREDLLREVRAFIDVVEQRTDQRIVVYAYPEFESRYQIATVLERRQWVRRIGSIPPTREWWIWQRDDRASIDGISLPADLNVMAP